MSERSGKNSSTSFAVKRKNLIGKSLATIFFVSCFRVSDKLATTFAVIKPEINSVTDFRLHLECILLRGHSIHVAVMEKHVTDIVTRLTTTTTREMITDGRREN